MSVKPATKPALKIQTTEYSPEAWDELELKRILMREHRIGQLFQERLDLDHLTMEVEKKLKATVGDPKKTNLKILHLAVKNAGVLGLALADARRYVPDPTDLGETRDFLLAPKDDDGADMPPLIKEKRGKNNEIRLFLVEQEDEDEAEAAE